MAYIGKKPAQVDVALDSNSITAVEMAANSVYASEIANNAITAAELATNSIQALHVPNATALVLDGGLTIDNININGTEIDLSSGDLTIDVAGDINLDADGGDWNFKDGGTLIGSLENTSSDFVMTSHVDDKDIIFKGQDSTSEITALTLDMSDAGKAIFAGDLQAPGIYVGSTNASYDFYNNGTSYFNGAVTVNDALTVDAGAISISGDGSNATTLTESGTGNFTIDTVGDIYIDADGGDIVFKDGGTDFGEFSSASNNLTMKSSISDADIKFNGNDGGSAITALTLDMSAAGAASFNAGITSAEAITVTNGNSTFSTASSWGKTLTLKNTNDDAGPAYLSLEKAPSSGHSTMADNDYIGFINMRGLDDAGNAHTYVELSGVATDVSNGAETSKFTINTWGAGTEYPTNLVATGGKVGIGTATPVYGLDVRSNGYFSTAASTVNLTLGDSTNGTTSGINTTNNALILLPNGSSEKLRLNHDGSIGIGGTNYGSDGQVLTSGGSGAAVAWETPSSVSAINDLSDATTDEGNSIMLGTATHGSISGAAQNTSVGIGAMDAITSAEYTVAVGYNAGTALTSGNYNTAVGGNALITADDGHSNTAIGMSALKFTTSGDYNTAVGRMALSSNTTANDNTAVGYNAGTGITTGTNLIAIGVSAMSTADNVSEASVAVGNSALSASLNTDNCVAVGHTALSANASGDGNTAVGKQAIATLSSTSNNTAVGMRAGWKVTGENNVFMGSNAAKNATSTDQSIVIGYNAVGTGVMTGDDNVILGANAGEDLTSGETNVIIGRNASDNTTSSDGCVAIGYGAMGTAITTGNENTIVGKNSGTGLTSGSLNAFFGTMAGDGITTGYRNTMIGQRSDGSVSNAAYQIAIGEDCISTGQSRITMGSGNGDNRIWNEFGTNASWTRVSDIRYKKDIQNNTDLGLDFIKALRPVTFKFRLKSEIDNELPDYDATDSGMPVSTNKMYGLIAQEVKTVLDDQGITDFGGWSETENDPALQAISQEMFVHPLIKAVQELSAKLEAAEARITVLEG